MHTSLYFLGNCKFCGDGECYKYRLFVVKSYVLQLQYLSFKCILFDVVQFDLLWRHRIN